MSATELLFESVIADFLLRIAKLELAKNADEILALKLNLLVRKADVCDLGKIVDRISSVIIVVLFPLGLSIIVDEDGLISVIA